jgi:catechol-2,3-dioxygenase
MAGPTFAHIVVKTNRLEEMRDWYCTVLDAKVVYENAALSFLTNDDEHHRIAFLRGPAPFEKSGPAHTGLLHSAWTFPDLQALMDRFELLKLKGIEPAVPIQHGVTTSLYYADPDGIHVELQIDNFADPDEATRYMMDSDEFNQDPIGPSFDPQSMADALRSGTPVSELTTRTWALSEAGRPRLAQTAGQAKD